MPQSGSADRRQMSFGARRRTIVFAATGIFATPGGIASANRNVLLALQEIAGRAGLEVSVIAANEPAGTDAPASDADIVYRTAGGNRIAYARMLLAALPGARLVVFDHVRLALPLRVVPRFLSPRVAIAAHGSEAWRRVRPGSIALFRAANLVFTNSHYTLRRMQSCFDGFNGVALPLGLPPTFVRRKEETVRPRPMSFAAVDGVTRPLGARVVLLVSRLDPGEREKGHRELIGVLPSLSARFPDVQLVFAGSGADAGALADVARSAGMGQRVFLTGQLGVEELQDLYDTCAVYAMPSRQEGFGLTYLEAMNSARPCIACHDDGGADVVVDGETGLLVSQPIQPDDLLVALSTVLGDAGLGRRMGLAGRDRLAREFTAEAYQARLCAALGPLVA
ncbi:MAG: glycosyltransferase family 4 protein [Pseudomonadota bacterium]|nr:glycosyltransferase family 4 protein [Pseudomonadota bacterium]